MTDAQRRKFARELGRRGGLAAGRNMTKAERLERSKKAQAGRAKKKAEMAARAGQE